MRIQKDRGRARGDRGRDRDGMLQIPVGSKKKEEGRSMRASTYLNNLELGKAMEYGWRRV